MSETLNKYLVRGTYSYKVLWDTSFYQEVIRSIDNGKPVICQVNTKELPHYNNVALNHTISVCHNFLGEGYEMKYIIRYISIFMAVLLCYFLIGCESDVEKLQKNELPLDLELAEDEESYCCYSGEEKMTFSVGKDDKETMHYFGIPTDYLALVDLKTNEKMVVEVNEENCVMNALPYQNGLIYCCYTYDLQDNYFHWSVNYVNGESEKIELDKGIARNYSLTPRFANIDGQAIYLYETISTDKYEWGIKKVVDIKPENMIKELDGPEKLLSTEMHSNGKAYSFMFEAKNKKDNATMAIGDLDGIRYKIHLDGKITSYGISQNYAYCGIGIGETEDSSIFKIQAVRISSGESTTVDVTYPAYRMSSTSGERIFLVDNLFNVYTFTEKELEPQRFPSSSDAVVFHEMTDDQYIFEYDNEFYLVD